MTREEAETKYNVKLTPDNLYPDRTALHRNMGPPELFPCCGARGWYPTEDGRERYCTCAAGNMKRSVE